MAGNFTAPGNPPKRELNHCPTPFEGEGPLPVGSLSSRFLNNSRTLILVHTT